MYSQFGKPAYYRFGHPRHFLSFLFLFVFQGCLYSLAPGSLLCPRTWPRICVYLPWPQISIYRSWPPICIYQSWLPICIHRSWPTILLPVWGLGLHIPALSPQFIFVLPVRGLNLHLPSLLLVVVLVAAVVLIVVVVISLEQIIPLFACRF